MEGDTEDSTFQAEKSQEKRKECIPKKKLNDAQCESNTKCCC